MTLRFAVRPIGCSHAIGLPIETDPKPAITPKRDSQTSEETVKFKDKSFSRTLCLEHMYAKLKAEESHAHRQTGS